LPWPFPVNVLGALGLRALGTPGRGFDGHGNAAGALDVDVQIRELVCALKGVEDNAVDTLPLAPALHDRPSGTGETDLGTQAVARGPTRPRAGGKMLVGHCLEVTEIKIEQRPNHDPLRQIELELLVERRQVPAHEIRGPQPPNVGGAEMHDHGSAAVVDHHHLVLSGLGRGHGREEQHVASRGPEERLAQPSRIHGSPFCGGGRKHAEGVAAVGRRGNADRYDMMRRPDGCYKKKKGLRD
jgi:hypothetical protein